MHLLVDAQLPPALAKWLIGRGHVAAHDLRCASARVKPKGAARRSPKTARSNAAATSPSARLRNTFVVPVSNLPPSFTLFEYINNQYTLVFTEQMDGKVKVGDADLTFAALHAAGPGEEARQRLRAAAERHHEGPGLGRRSLAPLPVRHPSSRAAAARAAADHQGRLLGRRRPVLLHSSSACRCSSTSRAPPTSPASRCRRSASCRWTSCPTASPR